MLCLKKIFAVCFFIVGLFAAGPTHAQANKALTDILNYQDFTSLIMYNSRRVPDLQKLWAWAEQAHQKDIYWAGGTLRGFLHWHYLQLQNHTPEELRKMPMPTISELQGLGGVDIDFVGPYALRDAAVSNLKHLEGLDYIDSDTYSEYSQCGGPTIEKIGLNPNQILDPYHGLRHYYEAKIVFQWVNEHEFRSFPWIQDGDFSKTTEALRFIRFGYYNLPELKPDPASIAMIRTISNFEIPFLRQPDRLMWAGKALKKLIISSHDNLPEVLRLLNEYNLTPVLVDALSSFPLNLPAIRAWSLENTHLEIEKFLEEVQSSTPAAKKFGLCADIF